MVYKLRPYWFTRLFSDDYRSMLANKSASIS